MIKAAIVGFGWWGRHMAKCVQSPDSGYQLMRIVDVDVAAARELAPEMVVSLSADLTDALDDTEIDAVILTTPHHLHEQQIIQCARAGKHVFCEKPLTMTRAGAERAVAACRKVGVQLGVGHERRFEAAIIAVRELVKSGALGTILHVEADSSHDKLKDLGADNWRVRESLEASIPMTGMGIHVTDFFIEMFGNIESVCALKTERVVAHGAGDVLTAQLRFESGLTGSFCCISVTPFFYRYHVFGSDGWAQIIDSAHPDDTSSVATLTTCFEPGILETRTFGWSDTVTANLRAFASAIEGRATYPFTDDQLINNVAVLEALAKSIRSGRAERVSLS